MLLANQTFYLVIFVTLLGLMAVFFWGDHSQGDRYRMIYWPMALFFLAISSLCFYLAHRSEIFFLTMAHLFLISGVTCISLLFYQWSGLLTPLIKKLSIAWLIAIVCFYIYLVNFGSIQDGIHLMTVGLGLILVLQIFTLFKILKKDSAYQIKLIIAVELFQLCARFLRSYLLMFYPGSAFSNLYQENVLGFSLRAASFLSNLLVCILIGNYYLEKLMRDHKKSAHAIESGMLHSLNALSMVRDNETGNHILRTKKYVQLLANRLRLLGFYKSELTDDDIVQMSKAAPLHDIGKVGIPDSILKKDGPLSNEEWNIMKTHSQLGEEVLKAAMVEDVKHAKALDLAIKIAGGHHESWDGSGYPRGLMGLNIPLAARIMALADMYDALVSERIYKDRWKHDDACAEIVRLNGTRFDPALVEAFLAEKENFLNISLEYRDAV